MTIRPTHEFQPNDNPMLMLQILQIDLFVIPALAIDATGYRICLRVTSNRGYGWSEKFLDHFNGESDLELWKLQLTPYVGHFNLDQLTKKISDYIHHHSQLDYTAMYLFTNALHQLTFLPDSDIITTTISEEAILKRRSLHYFSIYSES